MSPTLREDPQTSQLLQLLLVYSTPDQTTAKQFLTSPTFNLSEEKNENSAATRATHTKHTNVVVSVS